jgi:O-antigen/teichoic acid export membrane protein
LSSPLKAASAHNADTLQAARNGLKLFLSLVCTYGISIAVTTTLPRTLGPELFGKLNIADDLSGFVFVILTLGIDVYIRKEVAVNPNHATDFLGGLIAVRTALTVLLLAALSVWLPYTGRGVLDQRLVYVLGVAQLFVMMNESLSACLHAKGRVDGLSIVNVVSKLSWGLGIALALIFHWGLFFVALAYLVPEVLKSVLLWVFARDHLALRFVVNLEGTKHALRASLPFYVNAAVIVAYNRLGGMMLGVWHKIPDHEVGWFSGANRLALLTMIVTPLIGWVMQPLLSKAAARSEEELTTMMRRSLELVLCLAVPVSLAIGVGADVWIKLINGDAYLPSVLALRILAPRFLLSYVSIFLSICLITVNRSWTLTITSAMGLLVNFALNWALVPWVRNSVGAELGGAGAGCALAVILTESVIAGTMLVIIGKRAVDGRLAFRLFKTACVCGVVIAFDQLIRPWGPARLFLDVAVYLVLATVTGAIPFQEMAQFVRQALSSKRAAA